jgi:mxaK protein
MRRAWIHAAFGAVALCCAAVAAFDGLRLKHAHDVARAVAQASTAPSTSGDEPEVRLARAVALSKQGAYADAQKLFDTLIQEDPAGDTGRAALFDLGNMDVRQALVSDTSDAIKSVPMLEQAKQRYRGVLRLAPDDWDARYNLERTLWLAPEASTGADEPDIKEQHNVQLRGSQAQDLP